MAWGDNGPARVGLIVFGVVLAVIVIALERADLPPVSWINAWQAAMMGGRYYPKLTFLIVFLLALLPVGLVALVVTVAKETREEKRPRRRRRDEDDA